MRTKSDFIRDAVKIHEKLLKEKQLPPKRKVVSTQTYDNSSSFCFENAQVRENLEIPIIRNNISKNILKFDGELSRGSRNPQTVPEDVIIAGDIEISNKAGLEEAINFTKYGSTFQREMNINEEEISANKRSEINTEKNEAIKYFISQK